MSVSGLGRRGDLPMVPIKILSLIVPFLSFRTYSLTQRTGLRINEFMPSNELAHENAGYDYADWMEIYDSSSSAIDLSGYFLTDKLQGRIHWRIPSKQPARTAVPANRGHVPFKLEYFRLDLA
jgi:hypothetical protein